MTEHDATMRQSNAPEADIPGTVTEMGRVARLVRGSGPTSGFWFLAAAALLALSIYALLTHGGAAFATVLTASAASGAAGGFIGLLFGVPRSGSRDEVGGITPNTNLEQVSDWLTKLIIGGTLTQLSSLRRDFGALCSLIAPGLGGGPEAAPVAGAIIVFFAVVGFFIGWFFARLRLGAAMSKADAALALGRRAERAERSGEYETAQAVREVARSLAPTLPADGEFMTLADRYDRVRANMPPGHTRTRQLDELVAEVRRTARRQAPTVADAVSLFSLGTQGARVVALGVMENDPQVVDFESVLSAIANSRSAFEQFHALLAVRGALDQLTTTDRQRLANVLNSSKVRGDVTQDASRASLVGELLQRVDPPSGDADTSR